jgi:hypothetical protein
MKIFHKSMVLLFLAFFTANATSEADPPVQDNTRVSVYLHPVYLITGASINMLLLYSTIEIPLSLYNAPIIKPSVWNGNRMLRIGSDFGWRHYLAGKGDGFFLQPQVGIFKFSSPWSGFWRFIADWGDDFEINKVKKSGTWIDGMLYMGGVSKFAYVSMYFDTGIGYSCVFSDCSLRFDSNLGIGVSF